MWLAALVPDIAGLGKLQKIPILYNTPYSFSIFLSLKTKHFNSTSQLIMDKWLYGKAGMKVSSGCLGCGVLRCTPKKTAFCKGYGSADNDNLCHLQEPLQHSHVTPCPCPHLLSEAAHIQCLINDYKGPASLFQLRTTLKTHQLQRTLWDWLRPLLRLHSSSASFCAQSCFHPSMPKDDAVKRMP